MPDDKHRLTSMASLVWRKLCGAGLGRAPVSRSCQIPGVRQLYRNAGLAARRGTFVEIGGFDGEGFSNTSFLADQGWRGIYVEPVPSACELIRRRHRFNKVAVVQAAVGESAGTTTLHVMGAFSTTNAATLAAYRQVPQLNRKVARKGELLADCLPLVDMLRSADVAEDFELLVVDVEGSEQTIVEQLAASSYRPRIAVIELEDEHPAFGEDSEHRRSHAAARRLMAELGYSAIFKDRINTMFRLSGTPARRSAAPP